MLLSSYAVIVVILGILMTSVVPLEIKGADDDDEVTCSMVDNNPCVCKMNNGSKYIDLTSAAQGEDGPWIVALDSTGIRQFKYYYDPCSKFNMHTCENTLVCQYDMAYDQYYDLGQEQSTKIVYEDSIKGIIMEYSSEDKKRRTNVTVICSNSFSFTATEDRIHPKNYIFRLTHPCACVGKCGKFNHPDPAGDQIPLWEFIVPSIVGGMVLLGGVVTGILFFIKQRKIKRLQRLDDDHEHFVDT